MAEVTSDCKGLAGYFPPSGVAERATLEQYVRHARRFGPSDGLFASAIEDGVDPRRIAARTGAMSPPEWQCFVEQTGGWEMPDDVPYPGWEAAIARTNWNGIDPPPRKIPSLPKMRLSRCGRWLEPVDPPQAIEQGAESRRHLGRDLSVAVEVSSPLPPAGGDYEAAVSRNGAGPDLRQCDCGAELAARNRSGRCRRCQKRVDLARRRAAARTEAVAA